ncbi:MAG: DUF86 domain-containing protein [Anaerolineae bacterium]|nr:DUF86 domain-containing protein [Anaerolineae bacterium]
MNNDDRVRLQHMLDAAHEALVFADEESLETLRTDRKLLLALVKDIEIIGEAASRLSDEIQQTNAHIPWPQIVGMRNRLIHAYFDIEVETVWKTVIDDLPPLITELETLLSSSNTDENHTDETQDP